MLLSGLFLLIILHQIFEYPLSMSPCLRLLLLLHIFFHPLFDFFHQFLLVLAQLKGHFLLHSWFLQDIIATGLRLIRGRALSCVQILPTHQRLLLGLPPLFGWGIRSNDWRLLSIPDFYPFLTKWDCYLIIILFKQIGTQWGASFK